MNVEVVKSSMLPSRKELLMESVMIGVMSVPVISLLMFLDATVF